MDLGLGRDTGELDFSSVFISFPSYSCDVCSEGDGILNDNTHASELRAGPSILFPGGISSEGWEGGGGQISSGGVTLRNMTGETFKPNINSVSFNSETKHTTPSKAYVAKHNTQAKAYVAERITIETKPETKHISLPPFPYPVRKYYSI